MPDYTQKAHREMFNAISDEMTRLSNHDQDLSARVSKLERIVISLEKENAKLKEESKLCRLFIPEGNDHFIRDLQVILNTDAKIIEDLRIGRMALIKNSAELIGEIRDLKEKLELLKGK